MTLREAAWKHRADLEQAVAAFAKAGAELGLIKNGAAQ